MSDSTLTSCEPYFPFLDTAPVRGVCFGIFVGFALLFVRSLLNRSTDAVFLVISPALCSIISYYVVTAYRHVDVTIRLIVEFLDFPFAFIEAALYIRMVCGFSRYILQKYDPPRGGSGQGFLGERKGFVFRVIMSIISVSSATVGLVLLFHGICVEKVAIYHGVSFGLLIFSFLFTIVCDNGMIADPCMILLRTALSLAPILSYSSGKVTMPLRLLLVIITFISFTFKFQAGPGTVGSLQILEKVLPKFKAKMAINAFVGMLLTFIVLSPGAFLRPEPRMSGWQSLIIPGIYFGIFLNEVIQFHVAATAKKTK